MAARPHPGAGRQGGAVVAPRTSNAEGRGARDQPAPRLDGIVIMPQGTGHLDVAGCAGYFTVEWDGGLDGAFNVSHDLNPLISNGAVK